MLALGARWEDYYLHTLECPCLLNITLLLYEVKLRSGLKKFGFVGKVVYLPRVTLIKTTILSLCLYLMSILHFPRKVRLRLEKIQRDFLGVAL